MRNNLLQRQRFFLVLAYPYIRRVDMLTSNYMNAYKNHGLTYGIKGDRAFDSIEHVREAICESVLSFRIWLYENRPRDADIIFSEFCAEDVMVQIDALFNQYDLAIKNINNADYNWTSSILYSRKDAYQLVPFVLSLREAFDTVEQHINEILPDGCKFEETYGVSCKQYIVCRMRYLNKAARTIYNNDVSKVYSCLSRLQRDLLVVACRQKVNS